MVERIQKPEEAKMSLNLDLVASMAARARVFRNTHPRSIPEVAAITAAMDEAGIRGDQERDAYRDAVRKQLRLETSSRQSAPKVPSLRRERLSERNRAENGHLPDPD